jgi:hypothetical protein
MRGEGQSAAIIVCKIYLIFILTLHFQAVLASRSRVFQKLLYHAPSPQRKKEPPPRENKLRLFLKRSSEPLLNLQNAAQQVSIRQKFAKSPFVTPRIL